MKTRLKDYIYSVRKRSGKTKMVYGSSIGINPNLYVVFEDGLISEKSFDSEFLDIIKTKIKESVYKENFKFSEKLDMWKHQTGKQDPDFAKLFDVSISTLNNWKNGFQKIPPIVNDFLTDCGKYSEEFNND